MEQLLDTNKAAEMGAAARERVVLNFSRAAFGDHLLVAIEEAHSGVVQIEMMDKGESQALLKSSAGMEDHRS